MKGSRGVWSFLADNWQKIRLDELGGENLKVEKKKKSTFVTLDARELSPFNAHQNKIIKRRVSPLVHVFNNIKFELKNLRRNTISRYNCLMPAVTWR